MDNSIFRKYIDTLVSTQDITKYTIMVKINSIINTTNGAIDSSFNSESLNISSRWRLSHLGQLTIFKILEQPNCSKFLIIRSIITLPTSVLLVQFTYTTPYYTGNQQQKQQNT